MQGLSMLALTALILVIIGGFNWFLIGLFNVNLVTALFGIGLVSRLIFIIVGAAAIYLAYLLYLEKSKSTL